MFGYMQKYPFILRTNHSFEKSNIIVVKKNTLFFYFSECSLHFREKKEVKVD